MFGIAMNSMIFFPCAIPFRTINNISTPFNRSAINIAISNSFIWKMVFFCFLVFFYVISTPSLSILLTVFVIETEQVLCFSLFPTKKLNPASSFFTNSFIIKLWSCFELLWKTTWISLGVLYFKLHMLCAAPLCLPV